MWSGCIATAMPYLTMPILRNASRAVIDAHKFTNYVLNLAHPRGRGKARAFKAVLGYDRTNYTRLIEEIRRAILLEDAVFLRRDRHGNHYRGDLAVACRAGRRRFEPDGSTIEAAMSRGSPQPSFSSAHATRAGETFGLFDVVRVSAAARRARSSRFSTARTALTSWTSPVAAPILRRQTCPSSPSRPTRSTWSGSSDREVSRKAFGTRPASGHRQTHRLSGC